MTIRQLTLAVTAVAAWNLAVAGSCAPPVRTPEDAAKRLQYADQAAVVLVLAQEDLPKITRVTSQVLEGMKAATPGKLITFDLHKCPPPDFPGAPRMACVGPDSYELGATYFVLVKNGVVGGCQSRDPHPLELEPFRAAAGNAAQR